MIYYVYPILVWVMPSTFTSIHLHSNQCKHDYIHVTKPTIGGSFGLQIWYTCC